MKKTGERHKRDQVRRKEKGKERWVGRRGGLKQTISRRPGTSGLPFLAS